MITGREVLTERVNIPVEDGTMMAAFVARPAEVKPGAPGMLVLQDQFGVTDFLRDVAVRFAELGAITVAPALYHRAGGYEIPYADGYEASKSFHQSVTIEGQILDAVAAYRWLVGVAGNPEKIAAMGFCMGGRLAYLANAHVPLKAAISFYGGRIAPDLLGFASQQHGPLLFFWGGLDDVIPKEQYRALADGLTAVGADHDHVVFGQARHAFFAHPRPEYYHERSSRLAWAMSLQLLRAQDVLPPSVDGST